tara:strand:+ start:128 stop:649 length:522 start_codon:yes stop_codon:yes gene_type:complete
MFSHYNNKWRHEKTCKNKVTEKSEIIELKEKIIKLEKEIGNKENSIDNKQPNDDTEITNNDNTEIDDSAIDDTVSYIYLIQERENFEKKNNIYKFGRTTQIPNNKINRLLNYKKGSKILCVMNCNNDKVKLIETNIKTIFKQEFKNHQDGFEHYDGNKDKMIDIILLTIKKYN